MEVPESGIGRTQYQGIRCECEKMARVVITGVGTYIICRHCGRETYMHTTTDEAIRAFREGNDGK